MSGSVKYLSRRRQAVNHLRNGNFLKIPREYTTVNNFGDFEGYTRILRTLYRYITTNQGDSQSLLTREGISGLHVKAQPDEEDFLAFWQIYGADGTLVLNEGRGSLDGGNLVTVIFDADGEIKFKQVIESFNKFRGKPVSLALSGARGNRNVKVSMSIDVGTEVLESRPFYSKYFARYYRMMHTFDVPLDISKFEVMITIEGQRSESVSLSGACLALGDYKADLPYSDNLADSVIPSGTVILWTGSACPSGYKKIEDDSYLFAYFGDPNAYQGDLREQERSPTLGDNRHDHAVGRSDEYQPAAFEVSDDPFVTPAVDQTSLEITQVSPLDLNQEYTGRKYIILNRYHTHLVSVKDDPVEPPLVKVLMCEKI